MPQLLIYRLRYPPGMPSLRLRKGAKAHRFCFPAIRQQQRDNATGEQRQISVGDLKNYSGPFAGQRSKSMYALMVFRPQSRKSLPERPDRFITLI